MNSYVSRLGLEFDPFETAPDISQLFVNEPRRLLMEQLQQSGSTGNALVLLTGPLGIGKTTFSRWLQANLPPNFSTLQVQASLFMGEAQLLESICQALSLDTSSSDSLGMRSAICDYAAQLSLSGRQLQLTIDDAHELGDDALCALFDIAAVQEPESALHILLAGEAQLQTMLQGLLSRSGTDLPVISLEIKALNNDETREYLSHKLRASGFSGRVPLSSAVLARIHQQSGGVPGTIDVLVRDELDTATDIRVGSRFIFPPVYWAVAAVVVVSLMLTLLMTGNDIESATQTILLEPVATVAPNPAPVTATAQSPALPIEETPVTPPPVDVLTSNEQPVVDAPGQIEEPSVDALQSQASVSAQSPVPVPDPQPALVSAPVSTPPANPSGPVFSDLEQRLLGMSPDSFTLQVLGSHAEASVKAFMGRQPDPENFAYFESRYQDRPWYVVTLGNFPSRELADTARLRLSQELRELNPWIRNLAAIQSDIKKFKP